MAIGIEPALRSISMPAVRLDAGEAGIGIPTQRSMALLANP
ncbi:MULTISPECIES: hypothetical protein [Cupriavidus]